MKNPFRSGTLTLQTSSIDGSVHLNRAMRVLYDQNKRSKISSNQQQETTKRALLASQDLLARQQDLAQRTLLQRKKAGQLSKAR